MGVPAQHGMAMPKDAPTPVTCPQQQSGIGEIRREGQPAEGVNTDRPLAPSQVGCKQAQTTHALTTQVIRTCSDDAVSGSTPNQTTEVTLTRLKGGVRLAREASGQCDSVDIGGRCSGKGGGRVDMWFVCRLFSPRRRQRPRSASDSHHGQQQQQGEEGQEEEDGEKERSACTVDGQPAAGPEDDDIGTSTWAGLTATRHDVSTAGQHVTENCETSSVAAPRESDSSGARSSVKVSGESSWKISGDSSVKVSGEGSAKSSVEYQQSGRGEMADKEEVTQHYRHHFLTDSAWPSQHCDTDNGDGAGDMNGDVGHRAWAKNGDGPEVDAESTKGLNHYVEDRDHQDHGDHMDHQDLARGKVQTGEETEDEGLREQLAMVEGMVQEMKESFMAALEQLSGLQEGDVMSTTAWQKMDNRCQRQDQQLSDFAQSVDSLRKEVSRLSESVQQVMNTQQALQDQLHSLQTGQHTLRQELVSSGILTSDRDVIKQYSSVQEGRGCGDSSQPRSQHLKGTDCAQGSLDTEKTTNVTAAACKSLSLTQALAARCQDIDVSDSSEEDVVTSSRGSRQARVDHHGQSLSHSAGADTPQRRQAMQDIVESEQEYCSQLWTMMQAYQQPLQDGHYMSSRQLCVLFPSPLSDLYQHHSHMLQALQDRLIHASYAGAVGDVFARLTDSNSNLLGLYQEYVESLPGSISCLRRQMAQSRTFRTFVKEQRDSNPNGDLLTLLISPLQRIPKYMLQLQEVLRHTGEDHPDHFHLQASLGKLQDFVERFNHDITHTTQAVALHMQHLQGQGQSFRSSASNSSCEMLPPTTSTIDSGIQSTGEDTFAPPFLRTGRAEHDGYQWAEQTYHHTDPRHRVAAHRPGQLQTAVRGQRLASHSQPDLTHNFLLPGSMDPQSSAPHLRPFNLTPTTTGDHSARNRRYKIKKRVEGQGHYGNPPSQRPSSAMDFGEGGEREDRDRGSMRPHSVLGPFPGDGRSRVIQVYGRKPPRVAQRRSDVGMSSLPLQHVSRPSPHAHIHINGHWDPSAGGDHIGQQGGNYGPLVDYDDEEDDTRALSDAPSTGSHKASSHNSHDVAESETDNSDDFSQEDLAAALSHHLKNGGGAHTVSAHELRVKQQPQPLIRNQLQHNGLQYNQQHEQQYDHQEEEEEDEHVDVQLDSPESDLSRSLHQTQKPPHDMSEELKLDLTCFHDDNEGKPNLLKRGQPPAPPADTHMPLTMNPISGGDHPDDQEDAVPQPVDRSQTEPSKEVVHSLSGDKTGPSLPPIHPQDALPIVADTLDRPPVRRSITPSEFSNVTRPAVLRRAATPSEYLASSDSVNSKGAARRRKDSKNTSNETLHRSVDDVSLSASKKKPFRTSLKNLFQRKKGCIILDELEREYTKELVRQCLINNNSHTTTTTINNNNLLLNHTQQAEEGEGNEEGEGQSKKKNNSVSTNNIINTNNNSSQHQNPVNSINNNNNNNNGGSSLWSKMRKSPLFSLAKGPDNAAAEPCVV